MSQPYDDEKFNYDQGKESASAEVTVAPVLYGDEEANEEPNSTIIDVNTGLTDGVQRNMKQRHMQMIALAGTLGTGLFLGSGKAIAHAGPAGALLAYALVGSVSYAMLVSLGEMCVFAPISGGYITFAGRWADSALGFAIGWQGWFSGAISLPTEVISASILISYWDEDYALASHQAAYIIAILALIVVINFLGVRWYGESEFMFAMIKILLIVGCIIGGLAVDLMKIDGSRRGFQYWKNPGAFAPYYTTGSEGKFLGWFTTLLQAAYSYLGMEGISIAAGEVQNPRKSVSTAVRRIFYRIATFYIVGIFIVGLNVPYTSPDLLQSTGTAASSPFVIAFQSVGAKGLPSVINAGVLTSAFSAASSGLYGSSRQIYSLALRGQAPKIFVKTTKNGLPWIALIATALPVCLSFMALSSGAETVLNDLSNLTALSGFITWAVICVTYLRFKKGVERQDIDRSKFHYWNKWQPWPAYWCIFWSVTVIIFNGWEVFTNGSWNTVDFVLSYINIPIFAALYFGWKFVKKTKIVTPEEMDFYSNIPTEEEVAFEEPPPKNVFEKILQYLFT